MFMFLIKTEIGNFSDYRSLYYEMKNLKIERLYATATYIGTVVFKGYLTIEEVCWLYQESE